MNDVSIVLPSLNPDEKMTALLDTLCKEFSDIIIVNDGSDDEHLTPFEIAKEKYNCHVLVHEVNKGKGRALKTAFEYVAKHRPESKGVITIDGDGQHLTKDIKACAQLLIQKQNTIVLGARDFNAPHIPFRSRFGNKFTAVTFGLLCGMKISDTQTGLRAIPKEYLDEIASVEGERFEYETNMLLHINKVKLPFTEVKISTVYLEDNESSHFNPIKDSIKIYKAILSFSISSLASSLLDIGLFSVLNLFLSPIMDRATRILIATVVARISSALFNFAVNKKAVFKSDTPSITAIRRYAILCVIQMLVSYGAVNLLSMLLSTTPFFESVIKVIVDVILFFFSYQFQKNWVFK